MSRIQSSRFLIVTAGLAILSLLAVSRIAVAQTYPSRPVHWIVTAAPGGPADTLARLMGSWLTERLGQPFVIESRSGAGGNIGTEAVVRAPADGYTIHLTATSDAINATYYENLKFDIRRDLAPIARLIQGPFVMVVSSSFPARTLTELIAYAKANPGKINFASGGSGFASHISGELFKMMAGVNMVHVPYRGQGPAMVDLLGSQVQLMFDSPVSSLIHIRSGKLRPLAVTTSTRSDALPDVPAIGEFVPGYEASIWFGVCAPRNTPPAIIELLNKEINAGLADPKIRARLAELGSVPRPMTSAEFSKFIAEEVERWGKAIRAANIRAG